MTATISTDDAARAVRTALAGKSDATATAYLRDLRDLADFLEVDGPEAAAAALLAGGPGRAHEVLGLWQDALRRRLAPTTVNRRLAAAGAVVRAARSLGLVEWALKIRLLPVEGYRDTAGPPPEKVREMIAWAGRQQGPQGPRDVAILALLFGLALRRGEVVELDIEHVDIKKSTLSVLGKGRVQRESLTMPPRVQEAVAEWIVARGGQDGPLFVSVGRASRGRRLSGKGVADVVKRAGRAVGVETTPHGLRHSAITAAIRAGHPLPDVQRFSRHRDLKTLQVYYDRVVGVAGEVAGDVCRNL